MAKVTMLVFLHRLTCGYMWVDFLIATIYLFLLYFFSQHLSPYSYTYRWTVNDQDLSLEKKSHIPRLKSGVPITLTALKDENWNNIKFNGLLASPMLKSYVIGWLLILFCIPLVSYVLLTISFCVAQ